MSPRFSTVFVSIRTESPLPASSLRPGSAFTSAGGADDLARSRRNATRATATPMPRARRRRGRCAATSCAAAPAGRRTSATVSSVVLLPAKLALIERIRQLEPETIRVRKSSRSTARQAIARNDRPVLSDQQREVPLLQPPRRLHQIRPATRGKTGFGIGGAERPEPVRPSMTSLEISRSPSGESILSRGTRSSGPSRSLAHALRPPAELADPAGLERHAGRLPVAAEAEKHVRAALEARQQVERRNAPARSVRHAVLDRQHERRLADRAPPASTRRCR